jgi:hypothetical protein
MNAIPTFVRDGGQVSVKTAADVQIVPDDFRLALLFGNLHGLTHDIATAKADPTYYGDFLELFSQVVEMSGRDVEAVYSKAYVAAVASYKVPNANANTSAGDLHAMLVMLSRDARNRGLQERLLTLVIHLALTSNIELEDLMNERAEQRLRFGGFEKGKFGSGGR